MAAHLSHGNRKSKAASPQAAMKPNIWKDLKHQKRLYGFAVYALKWASPNLTLRPLSSTWTMKEQSPYPQQKGPRDPNTSTSDFIMFETYGP
ncbi:uncharacterized protein ASPGLDRAFT_46011 [Aspergillus glaucus CBS 516.65]|uniref:Uncharacterized protein n=1 Tax=Aspergillus glaucus CBS 516.65 TaxID=1160497 RepID=A0A1L9VMC7_ASPGL|nr:hypothetical protein ASPGLDRAFT_46011 [Aspergillus glaucus CBS 516.65]OJJ85034.1 hypothetical protein ASPGLDRAFT_46011 [Aspergillus glaucus CBS 516.65]